MTDQQLDQASKNLEANPYVRARVKLDKLLWGPLAAPLAMRTDVVVGADLVYPMNVDESLRALLVTLQVLGRPTLLAYVERSEAVTQSLESGLHTLRQHRCRRLHLGLKTSIYALDEWAYEHQVSDSLLNGCTDTDSVSLSWS